MADAARIVERIRAAGANVLLDGGKLKLIHGKKLPADALDFIKRNAGQVAIWLEHEGEFEERAAILEYDGGLSRTNAESLARLLLAHPPADTDPADWSWFVGHAAKIMDGTTALRSAA